MTSRWLPRGGIRTAATLLVLLSGCVHPLAVAPQETADPLGWIVGHWSGTRFEPSTGDRSPLLSTITEVLAGAGQQEQLEIRTPKGTYRGLYLQVFDPRLEKSVIIYVNSTRRNVVQLEGFADVKRGEWQSASPQGPRRSKLVYERVDDKTWRRTQFVSEDEGLNWSILWVDELHHRRN